MDVIAHRSMLADSVGLLVPHSGRFPLEPRLLRHDLWVQFETVDFLLYILYIKRAWLSHVLL